MRHVIMFALLVALLYSGWNMLPHDFRATTVAAIKKRVLPAVLFSAAVTISLLAFSFLSNGKVI